MFPSRFSVSYGTPVAGDVNHFAPVLAIAPIRPSYPADSIVRRIVSPTVPWHGGQSITSDNYVNALPVPPVCKTPTIAAPFGSFFISRLPVNGFPPWTRHSAAFSPSFPPECRRRAMAAARAMDQWTFSRCPFP